MKFNRAKTARLRGPDLPSDFLPLKSLDALPNNLPRQLTRLIGREREVATGRRMLKQARLLTFTGPAGVGKTRLAIAVAQALSDEFRDSVVLIDLSPIRDPALVSHTIAQALGVRDKPDRAPIDLLKDRLRQAPMLLILDNFEQVIAAALQVDDLLGACPELKLIVTSREALHLTSEQEFPVRPLALPEGGRLPSVSALAKYAAVALFLERARAVRPDFALTPGNAATVTEICARLDGLPLALELAAGRIKVLSPRTLLERLERRLDVLTRGPKDLVPRHQSLRAALVSSYDLLSVKERRLFCQLGVFVGGCTLEGALAVCTSDEGTRVDILEGLTSLVDKSLLQRAEQPDGATRFFMLETIREFALEHLSAGDELDDAAQRHAEHVANLAEASDKELVGPNQAAWLVRLDHDLGNVRTALRWSLRHGQSERACKIAAGLMRYWYMRGRYVEGRAWSEEAAALVPAQTVARARALNTAGNFAWAQGDFAVASARFEEALKIVRELNELRMIAVALNNLGNVAIAQGDLDRARALLEESITLDRQRGDRAGTASPLQNLGLVARRKGNLPAARAYLEDALTIHREAGYLSGVAECLHNLGTLALDERRYADARAYFQQALDTFRDLGDSQRAAVARHNIGRALLGEGDVARANEYFRASLAQYSESGAKEMIAAGLESLASAASIAGRRERAARLLGAADALREAIRAPLVPPFRTEHEHLVSTVRTSLGQEAFASAWIAGRAMTWEQGVEYALREAPRSKGPLSRREQEVAVLVAKGLSNRDIAKTLFLTERTAQTHVQHILNKLGFSSRAQIAAWAQRHELVDPTEH